MRNRVKLNINTTKCRIICTMRKRQHMLADSLFILDAKLSPYMVNFHIYIYIYHKTVVIIPLNDPTAFQTFSCLLITIQNLYVYQYGLQILMIISRYWSLRMFHWLAGLPATQQNCAAETSNFAVPTFLI
jgi:hypothetical protein